MSENRWHHSKPSKSDMSAKEKHINTGHTPSSTVGDTSEPPALKPSSSTPTARPALPRRGGMSSQKARLAFKSPLRRESSAQVAVSADALAAEVQTLQNKEAGLDEEIAQLVQQGYREEELAKHIDQLHKYNEIKDIGQMLLGRIAMQLGVTTKDLYSRYGLDLED